jgi:mono/diheme cytochrome c family protein
MSMKSPVTVIVTMALSVSPALAAGDAAAGHALADRWCSSCHAVGGMNADPGVAVPFAIIAQNSGSSRSWVRAWLSAPHPRMPNMDLSRQEMEDVVAYLDTLVPPKND